jgi:SAM-dependent methyltransferase
MCHADAMPSPAWERDDREVVRAMFDEDAEAYDRTRPVAPESVFDDLVALAGLRPGAAIVEIGAGTGQATRALAERGLRITAVELGANLAARARENLARFTGVEVVTASFEAWDPGPAHFRAVVACNSFHWIDGDRRFSKSAAVLEPDGHLVVLDTPLVVPDGADRFWWDVQDDYVAAGEEGLDPATQHPDRVTDLGPAVRASGLFEEPVTHRHLFSVSFTAEDYATNVSTRSGTKDLAPPARAELIERIFRRIVGAGGTVTVHLLAVLTVARRRS